MFRFTSTAKVLEILHARVNERFETRECMDNAIQFMSACHVLSKIVEFHTGIPAKLVCLNNKGKTVPHWVNVTEHGNIVDIKYLKQMGWTSGVHFIPPHIGPHMYNLTPTARDFKNQDDSFGNNYRRKYMAWTLDSTLHESWLPWYNKCCQPLNLDL